MAIRLTTGYLSSTSGCRTGRRWGARGWAGKRVGGVAGDRGATSSPGAYLNAVIQGLSIGLPVSCPLTQHLCCPQECDNLWWDAFTTEFFEDDAMLTITFCLEDGPKRYSKWQQSGGARAGPWGPRSLCSSTPSQRHCLTMGLHG